MAIYEPIGFADSLTKEALESLTLHHEMLQSYRASNWALAEKQLANLTEM